MLACAATLVLASAALVVTAYAVEGGNLVAADVENTETTLGTQTLNGDGSKVVQVAVKGLHIAALLSDGSVWTWGTTSTKVMDGAVQVAVGTTHYAAI